MLISTCKTSYIVLGVYFTQAHHGVLPHVCVIIIVNVDHYYIYIWVNIYVSCVNMYIYVYYEYIIGQSSNV